MPIQWKEIEIHFPKKRVAELRQEMCRRFEEGVDKNTLMLDYLISESALNEILIRYKDANNLIDFYNVSKRPKKPHRKLTDKDYERIKKNRGRSRTYKKSCRNMESG